MGKYRKIPIIVDAEQWFSVDKESDLLKEVKPHRLLQNSDAVCGMCNMKRSLHGWLGAKETGYPVCPGDWIVRGEKGNIFPVTANVFVFLYEEVENGG